MYITSRPPVVVPPSNCNHIELDVGIGVPFQLLVSTYNAVSTSTTLLLVVHKVQLVGLLAVNCTLCTVRTHCIYLYCTCTIVTTLLNTSYDTDHHCIGIATNTQSIIIDADDNPASHTRSIIT